MTHPTEMPLNDMARQRLDRVLERARRLKIARVETPTGATIVDFGLDVDGGMQAGIELASLCLSDLGDVQIVRSPLDVGVPTAVQVACDNPLLACMASQYAGWPLEVGDYRAMASGPMRLNRGQEPVIERYFPQAGGRKVLGVLEADTLPGDPVIEEIARQCKIEPFDVSLCVAPTRSIAGMIQIVARSVEATMHKLFELDFDLARVRQAWGTAPLPPPAADGLTAIGRTNDSILYGGQVQLWIDGSADELDAVAAQLPSSHSSDHGKPFREIFESYDRDFYAIDKSLFSAAEITLCGLQTGTSITVGKLDPELVQRSFQS